LIYLVALLLFLSVTFNFSMLTITFDVLGVSTFVAVSKFIFVVLVGEANEYTFSFAAVED